MSISPSFMLTVFEREGLCRRCSVSNQRLYLRFEFLAMKIVAKTPTIFWVHGGSVRLQVILLVEL